MKLVILNYATGITTIVDDFKNDDKTYYDEVIYAYIASLGFKNDDCVWMVSKEIQIL